jgi:hypothetical protein
MNLSNGGLLFCPKLKKNLHIVEKLDNEQIVTKKQVMQQAWGKGGEIVWWLQAQIDIGNHY